MMLVVFMQTSCLNDDDQNSASVNLVNVGDVVPEFMLIGANGETISSSSLGGQVYLLNFFDTTCPDCQKELPVLQQIYEKYKTSVTLLNVPRSQTREEVNLYWDKAGLSMPVYMASNKDLYYQFATRGIPRTYVIDEKGVIQAVYTDSPIADYNTLDGVLQGMLKGDGSEDIVDLSVRLNVAAPNLSEEDYFQNEYTVSHLELFFFDAETKKFVTKAVINDLTQDEDAYDKQYDISYIIRSLGIRVGIYNVFAIANYDYSPISINNQDELINLTDNITYQSGIEANIPDKGPVMTNRATSQLSIDLIPWAGKKYVMAIELERVLAKIQVGVAQNGFEIKHEDKKYAEVNLTNYKLVNLNKEYYLFQHKDVMSELGSQPQFQLPNHFSNYTDEGNQYIVDPYFYRKTSSMSDANKFADHYVSWFGEFNTENFASMPAAGNHGYVYILENTSFRTSQKNGYSPGIVFKAAVNPVFVYLYDTKNDALREEYRPEYWPRNIYLYNFNFYSSIRDINKVAGLSIEEKDGYTDTELKEHGIKQCKFNMGVYETFYTYWIQNIVNQGKTMLPMEYGIVRNHFYQMRIEGVSGLGSSDITPDILLDNNAISYTDMIITSD
jgi:peroxiredoxin